MRLMPLPSLKAEEEYTQSFPAEGGEPGVKQ
jgi:hypothetical protein